MQKVVCGVCGLANLESFPTYPLCAGCGTRLPERKRQPVHDFFMRPVKTLVWAFSVGAAVAILGLLSTGIARETRIRDRGPLLVSSSLEPDIASNGANWLLTLRVSTSLPNDDEKFRNLRLRFSQKAVREGTIKVLFPTPQVEDLGSGRYFKWATFKPGQSIRILLRPRETTYLHMVADGFDSFRLKIPKMN